MSAEIVLFNGKSTKTRRHILKKFEGHKPVLRETPNINDITDSTRLVITNGGDGTVQFVSGHIAQNNLKASVLVAGGGRNNALKRALEAEGSQISLNQSSTEQIIEGDYPRFHPGEIQGNIFTNDVGTGTVAELSRLNKKLHHLPLHKLHRQIEAFANWAMYSAQKHDYPTHVFQQIGVSAFYGNRKVSHQSLYDECLTRLSLDANSQKEAVAKLFWAYFCLGTGLLALATWKVTTDKQFVIDHGVDRFMRSGNIHELSLSAGTVIKRSNLAIPILALVK